ncbi:hypothetical protein ACFV20_06970 [Streptomyces sp. NPDC059696]
MRFAAQGLNFLAQAEELLLPPPEGTMPYGMRRDAAHTHPHLM